MGDGVEYRIDFDERRILTRFATLTPSIIRNLAKVIGNLGRVMYASVTSVEPNRTGKLRSQTRLFVDTDDNRVSAKVRILSSDKKHNVKAAALEYGAHRIASVQDYRRGGGMVAAYKRRTNIAAVRMLRNARDRIQAQALAEIQSTVGKTLRGEGEAQ